MFVKAKGRESKDNFLGGSGEYALCQLIRSIRRRFTLQVAEDIDLVAR